MKNGLSFLKSCAANIVKKGNFLTHFEGVTKAKIQQPEKNTWQDKR